MNPYFPDALPDLGSPSLPLTDLHGIYFPDVETSTCGCSLYLKRKGGIRGKRDFRIMDSSDKRKTEEPVMKRMTIAMVLFLSLMVASVVRADQGPTENGKGMVQMDKDSDLTQIVHQMQIQMQRMQETINSQNTEIQLLKKTQAARGQGTPVQAPSAPAFDLSTFQDMLGSSTDWIKGLKQGGDMRLRLEDFYFYDTNADHGTNDRDRNRIRMRLRYGFEKDLGDDFKAGFRLVTGNASGDPNASTNADLGNPAFFSYKPVFFDKAYATYTPHQLKDIGPVKSVTLGGGKFENLFLKYATTNVWDADITPEGAYETIQLTLYDTPENKLKSTINLGQLVLNEGSAVNADAEMFAYQTGFTYSTDYFQLEKPVNITAAISFYEYLNYYSRVVAPAGVAGSLLRTNIRAEDTRLEQSPQVLDLYHQTDFDIFERKMKFFANYTKNLRNETVGGGLGVGGEGAGAGDNGYGIGLRYGRNNKPGDWELNWAYYYLEANATAAAFADSDWGGIGGQGFTNRKGQKFGLTYRLAPSLELNWTGYLVTPVNDQSGATFSTSEKVFRTQSDLVWKF